MSHDYNATLFFKTGWLHDMLLNFVFGIVFIDHPVYVCKYIYVYYYLFTLKELM